MQREIRREEEEKKKKKEGAQQPYRKEKMTRAVEVERG
jgi:hypothetical protein